MKCKRKDSFKFASAILCLSRWDIFINLIIVQHFTVDDYQCDLQSELLVLPLKRILKTYAVPSKNLPEINKDLNCSNIVMQISDNPLVIIQAFFHVMKLIIDQVDTMFVMFKSVH